MEYSFRNWERRRRHLAPEADRVLPLVADTGTTGMTRQQLGHAVELDRDVLDQLLDGLQRSGLLSLTRENGVPVYRTTSGINRQPAPIS